MKSGTIRIKKGHLIQILSINPWFTHLLPFGCNLPFQFIGTKHLYNSSMNYFFSRVQQSWFTTTHPKIVDKRLLNLFPPSLQKVER